MLGVLLYTIQEGRFEQIHESEGLSDAKKTEQQFIKQRRRIKAAIVLLSVSNDAINITSNLPACIYLIGFSSTCQTTLYCITANFSATFCCSCCACILAVPTPRPHTVKTKERPAFCFHAVLR